MKAIFVFVASIVLTTAVAFSSDPITPLADHHTHLWSETASALQVVPPLPAVKLPDDLDQFLRIKEKRTSGQNRIFEDIKELYTEDALVLEATRNYWLRGPKAVKYITESTVLSKLVANGYGVDGSVAYITGTEVKEETSGPRHVSNFHYALKKGADGKWRVAVETFTEKGPPTAQAILPDRLIRELDDAGVRRAAVLSVAYWFGSPRRETPVENEYAKVKAENDWVAAQCARYPDRLVAFFSVNPLRDYALEELERCAKNSQFKGIKLHIGNSRIDVLNSQHVDKLRLFFAAANTHKLPIIAHLWTTGRYGPEHSEAFLKQIVPAAPDIPIQIAHLGASGPGYHSDDALEVYAKAAESGDPRMKNVTFDIAGMVLRDTPKETLALVAKRLRQLGMQRILFGSDRSSSNDPPRDAWAAFRRLPLTDDEFRTVAKNVAPYLR